jgi:hypothetical protein
MNEQQLCTQIVESLRTGIPPRRGINQYSVGNEKLIEGVKRFHLSGIGDRGIIRFVSGSWGAGKTHFFRQLREVAFKENILVSNVELDVSNAALNKFERVFYSIISNIETPTVLETDIPPDSAPFGIILREALGFIGAGNRDISDEVPYEQYEKAVSILMASNGIDIDFKKIVRKYWETFLPEGTDPAILQQTRSELLQWFSGEGTISSYRKRFEVIKIVNKENAKSMLQSLSEFVRLAGFRGLLILFDEAEQAYSIMRKSALRDAHNNLLSLINSIESLNGLFLLYATTPDFYTDPKHGIIIYGALAGRIGKPDQRRPRALDKIWNLDNVEIELCHYQEAARRIREVYLTSYPEATELLPKTEGLDGFVAGLQEQHPQFEAVRFWRVLVAGLIQYFDDCMEGDTRTPDQLYDDVMDRLRED